MSSDYLVQKMTFLPHDQFWDFYSESRIRTLHAKIVAACLFFFFNTFDRFFFHLWIRPISLRIHRRAHFKCVD